MSEKTKSKKTELQLENLRKGREKRIANMKKAKEDMTNSKEQKNNSIQFLDKIVKIPDKINEDEEVKSGINAHEFERYCMYDNYIRDHERKAKEQEEKETDIEEEENNDTVETAKLESFIFQCIDKYFERTKNVLNLTQHGGQNVESAGNFDLIKKVAPFLVAFVCAKYPSIVGSCVESIINPNQPNVIQTETELVKELTMEEKIEDIEKNERIGVGSVPIPKEQWKQQLNTSEVNTDASDIS